MTNLPYVPTEYSTKPGINKLEDENHFIIDEMLPLYLDEKRASRAEGIDKYYLERLPNERAGFIDIQMANQKSIMAVACFWMAEQIAKEYNYITFRSEDDYFVLDNELTNETVYVNKELEVIQTLKSPLCSCSKQCLNCDYPKPDYVNLFDALCSQIQEDVCVMQNDRLVASHVCLPSWWSPAEKIGKSMADIHAGVPGMDSTNYQAIWNACVNKGPFVRYNWGLTDNMTLNQHSDKGIGKDFDSDNLYLRVERQVLKGFPVVQSVIFLIRTFVTDVKTLTKDQRSTMAIAIENMSEEELDYKGVTNKRASIISWLR